MGVIIKGIGIAEPERWVCSSEIDCHLAVAKGTTEQRTGVKNRRYAKDESASELGAAAVADALSDAEMSMADIDCIISASGTMEQAIPYTGASLHRQLKLEAPIPTFDVNMTCLSAVAAIDVAKALIQNNTYKNILIVSSEIASVGVDWHDAEVGGLFGDGAAALVLGESSSSAQGVLASHFETYSEGHDYCQIPGGGSLNHPNKITCDDYTVFGMFKMQGKDAYRLTAKVMPRFLDRLLKKAQLSLEQIDWVVPHQASYLALEHLQKKFEIPKNKMINILREKGNQIAASIPTALHELIKNHPIKTGDKVMLIGTSAGISVGGIILEW